METIKFKVDDMIWTSCEQAIEQKLAGLGGVKLAVANSTLQEVTVLLDYPQSCEGLYCAVEDLGYHIGDRDGSWFR